MKYALISRRHCYHAQNLWLINPCKTYVRYSKSIRMTVIVTATTNHCQISIASDQLLIHITVWTKVKSRFSNLTMNLSSISSSYFRSHPGKHFPGYLWDRIFKFDALEQGEDRVALPWWRDIALLLDGLQVKKTLFLHLTHFPINECIKYIHFRFLFYNFFF